MSSDSHEPRPFTCPDCGHNHKADLHGMVGHPEVHGKVPCAKCERILWLSLDDQGEAVVELYEEHLHAAAHQERIAAHKARLEAEAALAAAQTPVARGPSLFSSVFAAAIVAILISLAMSASKSPGGSEDDAQEQRSSNARIDAMAQEIDDLRSQAAAARIDAQGVAAQIDGLKKLIEASRSPRPGATTPATATDTALLKQLQRSGAAFTTALDALQASYSSLHGRIEGNYTSLRQAAKRLDKLEAR